MNEVKIFEHKDFGRVRTVENNGVLWFVGKDVACVLKYTNPQKAIRDQVDEEDKGGSVLEPPPVVSRNCL